MNVQVNILELALEQAEIYLEKGGALIDPEWHQRNHRVEAQVAALSKLKIAADEEPSKLRRNAEIA